MPLKLKAWSFSHSCRCKKERYMEKHFWQSHCHLSQLLTSVYFLPSKLRSSDRAQQNGETESTKSNLHRSQSIYPSTEKEFYIFITSCMLNTLYVNRETSPISPPTRHCYPAGMIRECEMIAMLLYDGFFFHGKENRLRNETETSPEKRMRKSFDCVSTHSDSLRTFSGDNFTSSNSLNSFTACLICDDFFPFFFYSTFFFSHP